MMTVKISNDDGWLNWKEFNTVIKGKKVVFFGVSYDWSAKTFAKSNPNLVYYVDNNPEWVGTKFNGVMVQKPDCLKQKGSDIYVVITSGGYDTIIPQLIEMGLIAGIDFCITPALNNLKVITDINSHDATLLISSPDHKIYSNLDKDQNTGGGLFIYNTKTFQCNKVMNGTFHQIVNTGKEFLVVDETRGVCQVSKEFELLATFGQEAGGKPHGVAYCPKRDIVFISQTSLDKISAYSLDKKKRLFEIKLSDKADRKGSHHWVNDLCIKGDYLYISLFSHSGCRMEGLTDGGVVQIDLDDPEKQYVIMQNLWMPHTVRFFDSELCVLDSMNGYFYKTDKIVIGEFYGFIRGLAYDGTYFYVGQSETRYFDRLKGLKKNIGMSAGFYLFDDETKAAKFFSIPQVRQVHDLCIINKIK